MVILSDGVFLENILPNLFLDIISLGTIVLILSQVREI